MKRQRLFLSALLVLCGLNIAHAYINGMTPTGANRHWASGTIQIQFTGPTIVDGYAVHTGLQNAITSWNAVGNSTINFTSNGTIRRTDPSIGNGINEFGWVESSNDPYFIPGVPCTTAYLYDAETGIMQEADTICNAFTYQWPGSLFGNYNQDNVADAETAALNALGYWLGLDASLRYDDPMFPTYGSGYTQHFLSADNNAFGRQHYSDGTSNNGRISGVVRFQNGSSIPYAYVTAISTTNGNSYGGVADASGNYTVHELPADTYQMLARPLTTDPSVLSSLPYRSNPLENLDFSPEYYLGGAPVQVQNGTTTSGIDLSITRTGTEYDPYEPNNSQGSASTLTLGYSKLATSNVYFDKDWYSFQTSAGRCFVFETTLHGASIVPTVASDDFWSATRISLYDGTNLIAQNESRDDKQLDPGNWITYCESSTARRLDLKVEQRTGHGGAGYFYSVYVREVPGGSSQTPTIANLYPNSGWMNRNRFVWIEGTGFLPGASVDIQLPDNTWVAASQVITDRCDRNYNCAALKALFPTSSVAGLADVKVTNPNGRSATRANAFEYLTPLYGPLYDVTPATFGIRYGDGKAACVADYNGDGRDDILKTRVAQLPYQLFKNNGNGSISEVASSSGLRLYNSVFGRSCSWIDVDDDGDWDPYITNVAYSLASGAANELYYNSLANNGSASFTLNTPTGLGGDWYRYKSDAAWADYNNDGRLDVVLVYDTYAGSAPYYEAVQMFRQNTSGTFTNTTSSSGLGGYFATINFVKAADFNKDGCVDLVFFTQAGLANRLYRGNCNGGFSDYTTQSHIADGLPWCTGVGITDFDNDGDADIFCGTYNAGTYPVLPRLFLNNGSAVFTDRASEAGLYGIQRSMDVVLPVDQDNDTRVDVVIGASENGWFDDRKDVLLHNNGGSPPTFTDITDVAAMYPTTHDGSGYCGYGVDEYFCDRDAAAGGILDLNNDGAPDVFITGSDPDFLQRGADFLWRNDMHVLRSGNVAPPYDWVEVALKGANTPQSRVLSNRFGIGARVTVIPRFNLPGNAVPTETQCLQNPLPGGVVSYTREVLAGNQSQSSTVLHFGLGNVLPFGAKRVDCIKVLWPSGLEVAYPGITANTKVVLAEDAGRIKVLKVIPNTGANTASNQVTITGMRFDRDEVAVPKVYFGATPAADVIFVSEHELTAYTPLWQAPGTVNVTVENPNGESDTLLAGYTFTGSSTYIRFKDPAPDMLTTNGTIPNDPNFVATRGSERIGASADGVTRLVFEVEVGGPGRVRFALDDDATLGNGQPPASSIGSITPLSGGTQVTTLTTTVTQLSDNRQIAQVVYLVPQDFLRTAADNGLGKRPVWVNATYIDTANVEYPLPIRSFDLYRVPVLYMHGMWSNEDAFSWAIMNDARWIIHRADYRETNAVSFAENIGAAPRAIAELRKKTNDLGIAATRMSVFAHSMGAVLFKVYLSGGGAPYARADNFFAGDVYTLVTVNSPLYGSYLAPLTRHISGIPVIGPKFAKIMRDRGTPVDEGCMWSLDPEGPDTLNIGSATGTFHAIVGWGGSEMRAAGVDLVDDNRKLKGLENTLRMFNYTWDNYLLKCGTGAGDDFLVCIDSQLGGLSGSHTSHFHFQSLAETAIHTYIVDESSPSARAEQLLNTPTTNATVWALTLPATPPLQQSNLTGDAKTEETSQSSSSAQSLTTASGQTPSTPVATGSDGITLTLRKQGGDTVLSWVGTASRLLKSFSATLTAGVCLSVSGSSYTDAGALGTSTDLYYAVGDATLCTPATALSIASMSPASGSSMGGYTVTILGSGFDSTTKVKVGNFYASEVQVVNATTITFRMMAGAPGPVSITVVNSSGQSSTTTFTLTDPGTVPGSVMITAPAAGSTVNPGSTLTITAIGTDGFSIASAIAYSGLFSADTDLDPGTGFRTTVTIPVDATGPLTIELLAKDAASNMVSAQPVTITVGIASTTYLTRLRADKVTLLYGTPTKQLRVYGLYSDGVERDITHAYGIVYEMDTQDIRKPGYPYNGTGVAVVDSTGMVTAKTTGSTICHITYQGRKLDVVVEVAEIRPTLTIQKPGFISWPFQGSGVVYDVVRGVLSGLRASGGNYSASSVGLTCIKNNFADVTAADSTNPPAGDGYFYLMRESRTLSYEESPFWATRSQSGQRTAEINASSGACP